MMNRNPIECFGSYIENGPTGITTACLFNVQFWTGVIAGVVILWVTYKLLFGRSNRGIIPSTIHPFVRLACTSTTTTMMTTTTTTIPSSNNTTTYNHVVVDDSAFVLHSPPTPPLHIPLTISDPGDKKQIHNDTLPAQLLMPTVSEPPILMACPSQPIDHHDPIVAVELGDKKRTHEDMAASQSANQASQPEPEEVPPSPKKDKPSMSTPDITPSAPSTLPLPRVSISTESGGVTKRRVKRRGHNWSNKPRRSKKSQPLPQEDL